MSCLIPELLQFDTFLIMPKSPTCVSRNTLVSKDTFYERQDNHWRNRKESISIRNFQCQSIVYKAEAE